MELEVGSGHVLYVEQSGAADGIPVIYLHGGPGSGTKPDSSRRMFDPSLYRPIIFDQRGSGLSRPHGSLEGNNLESLIGDMERIRLHYGVEKWLVYGGSWGATLALAYAEAHPERVLAMVLRSVFLARGCDLQWHNGSSGARLIFPEAWQELCAAVPAQNADDPVSWIADRVLGDAPMEQRLAAAQAWDAWAGRVVTWRLPQVDDKAEPAEPAAAEDGQRTLGRVGIEMHYGRNSYFLRENQLLQQSGALPEAPIHILHGRCDMTCTVSAAWDLHQALPQSTLQVLPDAGHLSSEPQMQEALLRTLAKLPGELG